MHSVFLVKSGVTIFDVVGKMLCGMTVLLGSFVKEVGAARMQSQDTSGPSLMRSKRQGPSESKNQKMRKSHIKTTNQMMKKKMNRKI
jgi:hypothetical protein